MKASAVNDEKRARLVVERASRLAKCRPALERLGKLYAVVSEIGKVSFIIPLFTRGSERCGVGRLKLAHKLIPGLFQKGLPSWGAGQVADTVNLLKLRQAAA